MGTQSNIFVEKENGKYIGVFCQYDGYPSHMLEHMQSCSHGDLHNQIIIAGTKGGYRIFSPMNNASEFLKDTSPYYVYSLDDGNIDYIYVKCLDNVVKWRKCDSRIWHTT